ncbi:Scramblase-domain-containing protein [Dipodascopsis tothii]|uniref:Scramblase-domain-containing protein n=1 Tax=Dipodascopsis tothii TaxID=44089 RepID=UPI0034CE3FAC
MSAVLSRKLLRSCSYLPTTRYINRPGFVNLARTLKIPTRDYALDRNARRRAIRKRIDNKDAGLSGEYDTTDPYVEYHYKNGKFNGGNEIIYSKYGGSIQPNDGIASLLSLPQLVIERQLEMMNVFLGFEQANRYTISDTSGNLLGYMEEEDYGFTKAIMRQIYRLHRPFSVRVSDVHGNHLLTIRRPFSFINSHIKILLPGNRNSEDTMVGEAQQSWHLWRRRYNLFLREEVTDSFDQFAAIDEPFLAFDFNIRDEESKSLGSVNRNWVGLGRELFTDTGVYILQLEPSKVDELTGETVPVQTAKRMSYDERAVVLGAAISIDFDYFSRKSRGGGGFLFFDDV